MARKYNMMTYSIKLLDAAMLLANADMGVLAREEGIVIGANFWRR